MGNTESIYETKTDAIVLPIGVYRFRFKAHKQLELPEQPGVLWHSVFGKALYDLVCRTRQTQCESCIYLHNCDYPHLFRGTKPPNSELMRKYQTIPSPHVLRSIPGTPKTIEAGDETLLDAIIIGNANSRLKSLVSALQRAGEQGLGRNRTQLDLFSVSQQVPDGNEPPTEAGPLLLNTPTAPAKTTVSFITPYKPSDKNHHNFEVALWLMAIIRRVGLLQYFTTGVKLNANFKYLKELTEQVSANTQELKWHYSARYSAAFKGTKDTSGFIGQWQLDISKVDELWPFLWLGQWLHVGKNSSMGFGQYQLSQQ